MFLNNDIACLAYSPTEFAIFSLTTMTASDISLPLPISTSGAAMNAFTGLTGYMTLGLGAKAKPAITQVAPSNVLLAKDGAQNQHGLCLLSSSAIRPGLFHRRRFETLTAGDRVACSSRRNR